MAKLKENMARFLRGKFGDKNISRREQDWWRPLAERDGQAQTQGQYARSRARTILGGDRERLGG